MCDFQRLVIVFWVRNGFSKKQGRKVQVIPFTLIPKTWKSFDCKCLKWRSEKLVSAAANLLFCAILVATRGRNRSFEMSDKTDWERVLQLVKDLLCGQLELDNSEDDAQRDSSDSCDENSHLVLRNMRKVVTYIINVVHFVCNRDLTEEELDQLNEITVAFGQKVKKFQDWVWHSYLCCSFISTWKGNWPFWQKCHRWIHSPMSIRTPPGRVWLIISTSYSTLTTLGLRQTWQQGQCVTKWTECWNNSERTTTENCKSRHNMCLCCSCDGLAYAYKDDQCCLLLVVPNVTFPCAGQARRRISMRS